MHELHSLPARPPVSRPALAYQGPERRAPVWTRWRYLSWMLDEIDYGMLLVEDDGLLLHANHAACAALDGGHPLVLRGGSLGARCSQDALALRAAVGNTVRHAQRSLLTLGPPTQRVTLSLIPMAAHLSGSADAALVVLGRQEICQTLSVQSFARCHQLTLAESQVLASLCAGAPPGEIAERLGVAISTVRTQISAIRAKTGAGSIGELVRHVATLPPIVGALRATPQVSRLLAALGPA